jgi:NitT/TauT family transport system ATP-binding protein
MNDASPPVGARDIVIKGLDKSFSGETVYRGFDLVLPAGRVVSVFGPNGCGKSTLINMLAGLIPADGGSITFGGKALRDTVVGYVFQNYRDALMPWMSAARNITWPLVRKGMAPREAARRLEELKAVFEVSFDLAAYPYRLSGGQQQLVSIMRALAPRPEVLFLDEPFSALDYEATLFIRAKLQEVQVALDLTTLIVSHDLEDAVFLADHILLLTRRPTSVAGFLPFPMARPRGPDAIADPLFIETQSRALEIFRAALK